ncbi:unnamed protein product, partial [Schistosoma rodhaini]|uniref:Uncharacterized protein n=1 Tax=Schistosoma rodhaini TaxID=6188 RepID=A0AA85EYM7_9TREM
NISQLQHSNSTDSERVEETVSVIMEDNNNISQLQHSNTTDFNRMEETISVIMEGNNNISQLGPSILPADVQVHICSPSVPVGELPVVTPLKSKKRKCFLVGFVVCLILLGISLGVLAFLFLRK